MKRYRWLLVVSVLAVIVALQYRGLTALMSGLSLGAGAHEPITIVKVAPVQKVSVPPEIIARGELEAVRQAHAVSQVSGYIEQIRFKTGDFVRQGQAVATFKAGDAQQRTAQIESNLRDLQVQLREKDTRVADAENELEKLRDLRRRDLIATNDLRGAETAAEAARAEKELVKAQIDQQQAALAQLRYMLKPAPVMAPLSGVVTETFVEPGGFVQNAWPILTIAASDRLKVIIKISEKDRNRLRQGSSATIIPEDKPERMAIGKVTAFDNSRSVKEAIVLVEVQLPNQQRQFNFGTEVSVVFKLEGRRDAFLIPRQALVEVDGKSIVYTVANQRAHAVPVTTRPYRDDILEVLEGLDENQQVIIEDPSRLKPDSKIRVGP